MVKLSLDFYDLEAIEAESERMRAILVKVESELDLERDFSRLGAQKKCALNL